MSNACKRSKEKSSSHVLPCSQPGWPKDRFMYKDGVHPPSLFIERPSSLLDFYPSTPHHLPHFPAPGILLEETCLTPFPYFLFPPSFRVARALLSRLPHFDHAIAPKNFGQKSLFSLWAETLSGDRRRIPSFSIIPTYIIPFSCFGTISRFKTFFLEGA